MGEEEVVAITSTARDDMDLDVMGNDTKNRTTFDHSDGGEYLNFDVPMTDVSANDD